jgi:hypothetical protein
MPKDGEDSGVKRFGKELLRHWRNGERRFNHGQVLRIKEVYDWIGFRKA